MHGWVWWLSLVLVTGATLPARVPQPDTELDARVRRFLENHRGKWRDLNVPWSDGQALYDLILERGFTRALEIGTSTGHSAIWMAWALSKTGGRLITIEIDERRYRQALENFRRAGVAPYIEARLGDAHRVVRELAGPFDFIFCDADKTGYVDYLQVLWPKIAPGSCFTAHNVLQTWMRGIPEFLDFLKTLPNARTRLLRTSTAGLSVTCKQYE